MGKRISLAYALQLELGPSYAYPTHEHVRPRNKVYMHPRTCDSTLTIKIPSDLRRSFQDACYAHGRPYSEVLRELMAEYVERNQK